jgi:hypothetical protein
MGENFFSRQVGPVWKNCFAFTPFLETSGTGRKNVAERLKQDL